MVNRRGRRPGGRSGGGRRGPGGRDAAVADGPRRSAPAPAAAAPASPVELPATLTVGELSEILGATPVDTIKALMRIGVMATVNEIVEFDTAAKVAAALNVPVLKPREREESTASARSAIEDAERGDEAAKPRPPVITVLGHVDHGKTTLLDAIRGTSVVTGEAGGITQGIGAYQVERNGQTLTFIDTPGHAAFTAMRASGAQVTDIAVLVVAANDGVMPQTIEAIDHAKAAKVPIVVAMNKMDAEGADPDRVKGQLAEQDVVVEDYGGDVVCIPVSALKNEGVDDLLESLLLVAEVSELKANPDRPGIGVVIESHLDRARGAVATVLVRVGTLRLGDNVVAGIERGRIRQMIDGFGKEVDEAGPATPVQVLGLSGIPSPGEQVEVVEDERSARQLVETREKLSSRQADARGHTTMADVMRRVHQGDAKELNLVIKAGTQGSVDAVRRAVEQLSSGELQVRVLHAAAGAVTESDVLLSSASAGMIVAFDTNVEAGAQRQADAQGVAVRTYNIIYELIDDVAKALKGLLEPEEREVVLGHATVQAVFPHGRREKIAGVRVTDGTMRRNARVRVKRGNEVIFEGSVDSMRHLKDNVRELATNFEGGLKVDGFDDFQEGDVIESFEIRLEER